MYQTIHTATLNQEGSRLHRLMVTVMDHITGDHGANSRQSELRVLSQTYFRMNLILERPPRRDWRDWFIMATVTGGVSYGLYTVAKVGSCVIMCPVC